MRTTSRALVAASIVLGSIVGGYVAPAAAAVPTAPAAPVGRLGIQLLDPPNTTHDPRASVYIVDHLKTGMTITRQVRVSNMSPSTADVSIYAAAASISGGQFRFGAGRAANDLTSWTSVTPSSQSLAPGASVDAQVTVSVPDQTTSGERYAVVWAQLAAPAVAGHVREINRVGVRMYLDIDGNLRPANFTIGDLSAARDDSGRPMVTAQVRNTGGVAVDVLGTAALSDGPGGLQTPAARTDETVNLAPGQHQSVSVHFDATVPGGRWLVTVKLASGNVHHEETGMVTVPTVAVAARAPTAGSTAAPHEKGSSAWWWALGSSLTLLALLAGFLIPWLIRRNRSDEDEATA